MEESRSVGYLSFVLALSDALDLVSPLLVGHHKRVAAISLAIAREMDLSGSDCSHITLASCLHDCGAFTLRSRLDSLEFEMQDPHRHAEAGYRLLSLFRPFEPILPIVRHHHLPWAHGAGRQRGGEPVPTGSHVVHLADRVAVLIDDGRSILEQRASILEKINGRSGVLFHPDMVDALNSVAGREYFWFEALSPDITAMLSRQEGLEDVDLKTDVFRGLVELFYRIMDFRSPFTATHTSGVQACARFLALKCGLSPSRSDRVGLAASLHDLGKLAVPVEILDKKTSLSSHEQAIVRGHPYYGYRILERFPSFRDINTWASYHHERIDGTGYPFHRGGKELPLESRIVAVADVFTALTEDRPYRPGMVGKQPLAAMDSMARNGKLDPDIVGLVGSDRERLDRTRADAQSHARDCYREFRSLLSPPPLPAA